MIVLRQGLVHHLRRHVRHVSQPSMNECTTERPALMSQKVSDRIVWMDMEMTGLDPVNNKILEVGCLITDASLNTISDVFEVVIHQPDEDLNSMDDWCTRHHEKSGLVNSSRNSTISNSEAEMKLLEFIQRYVPRKTCPIAGNSVYMDRAFLNRQMPLVDEYLHHRIIDVSSIKELARRWNTELFKEVPRKKFQHRAVDDINESIRELSFYKEHMFK